jgi:hypothetical protein
MITPFDERDVARKHLQDQRDFLGHLGTYLAVNAIVWSIWLIGGLGYPWPIWVTIPWGIGIVAHAISVYRTPHPITEEEIDREVDRMHHHHHV